MFFGGKPSVSASKTREVTYADSQRTVVDQPARRITGDWAASTGASRVQSLARIPPRFEGVEALRTSFATIRLLDSNSLSGCTNLDDII